MERTAVNLDAPKCFAMHHAGDKRCMECPYEPRCIKNTARNASRKTLSQAAEDAMARHRMGLWDASVTSEQLLEQLIELWNKGGGAKRRGWASDRSWHETMDRVIASCKIGGWSPRTFIKAQFNTVGAFCIKRGFKLAQSMVTGDKALMRFQSWARTNQRKYNDSHRDPDLDPVFEETMYGEASFGDLFIRSPLDVSAEEVERYVKTHLRSISPWSLRVTDQIPAIRLTAMSGSCSSIYPLAPSHILVPTENFSWHDLRSVVHDVFSAFAKPEELNSWSDSLGVLL